MTPNHATTTALALTLIAATASAETTSPELRDAVGRLETLRDQFQKNGVLPSPADLAPVTDQLAARAKAATERKDLRLAAEARVRLNWAWRMVGRWEPAIAEARQAVAAARQTHDRELEARARLGQAKAELSSKDLGPALFHAEAAARLAAAVPDAKLQFDTLDEWSQVQLALGQANAAAETLNRALGLPGLTDESLVYGYMDRASIYLNIAERCDYRPDFQACLQAVGRSRADNQAAIAAATRLGWNGLARQIVDFNKQLDTREWMITSRQRSQAQVESAQLFHPTRAADVLVTQRFAPASDPRLPTLLAPLISATQATSQRAPGFARGSTARLHYLDGQIAQAQGDHVKALASFTKAVSVLEENERALPDDASRTAFYAEYLDMYVAATLELLDQGRLPEAFAMSERSRARAMADLLATRRLDLGSGKEQALYGEQVRLDVAIADKEREIVGLLYDDGAKEDVAALEADLARLRKSRQALVDRVTRAAPRLRTLGVGRATTLPELQDLAKRDGCEVIEYLVTETNIVVWYIGPSAVAVRNVFLPRAVLEGAVAALQANLIAPAPAFDHRRARELYLQLVAPVRPFVKGSRLVVLPHDVLAQIPFEVLEDPADGSPLGARFEIAYAPSATIYAGIRPWTPGGAKSLVLVANPVLESGGHEGERVAATYGQGVVPVSDRFLDKAAFKRQSAAADVVHLSVHGHFNPSEPLLSYVELAPDDKAKGKDDGHLTAAEMFGLPLAHAALVVLSACESGKQAVTRGNEVLGMVRGLLYAGAGALVLSRWKVDAGVTALWMETFHREAKTRGLPAAAQVAAAAVRRDPRFSHPYYWSGFSLLGR